MRERSDRGAPPPPRISVDFVIEGRKDSFKKIPICEHRQDSGKLVYAKWNTHDYYKDRYVVSTNRPISEFGMFILEHPVMYTIATVVIPIVVALFLVQ